MPAEKDEKSRSELKEMINKMLRKGENPDPHAIKGKNPNAHGTTNNLPITPYVPPKNTDKKK